MFNNIIIIIMSTTYTYTLAIPRYNIWILFAPLFGNEKKILSRFFYNIFCSYFIENDFCVWETTQMHQIGVYM